MTKTLELLGVFCLLLAVQSTAFGQGDHWSAYRVEPSSDGRLVIIDRDGDRKQRTAQCWIYEFHERGKYLRLLHSVKLLNPWKPLTKSHTVDGRFVITNNEWDSHGTNDRALVIYDLVRKEHSQFAIKDFYSQEVIDGLPPHVYLPGVRWKSKQPAASKSYDYPRLEIYPNDPKIPEGKAEPDLPYLVIDLAARTVRKVPPPPENEWIEPEPYRPPLYFKEFAPGGTNGFYVNLVWTWSNGDGEEGLKISDDPEFPKYLKMGFTRKGGQKGFWVFGRGEDTEYYRRVDPKLWFSAREKSDAAAVGDSRVETPATKLK